MTCLISQNNAVERVPFVRISPVSNQFETDVYQLICAVRSADLSKCPRALSKQVAALTESELCSAVYDVVRGRCVNVGAVKHLSAVGYVFGVPVLAALSNVGGAVGYVADCALRECRFICCSRGESIFSLDAVPVERHALESLFWLLRWYMAESKTLKDKFKGCYPVALETLETETEERAESIELSTHENIERVGSVVLEYLSMLERA